ncbi:MAG: hypothetical protein KAJ33_03050, partial [Thermoplasmata archaeon]|nr:hypothetical protein [Thermoplasmata archaeon]
MTNGRERNGSKRNIILPMVILITFILIIQFPILGISAPADTNDTLVQVGDDFIVSFDNGQTALHPSIAITPTNPYTAEKKVAGRIHAVWDEFSLESGAREIHYSMSDDGGASWSGEGRDNLISDPRQPKSSFGDAINPSIAVDSHGIIHVVWAEHYAADNTWEVHYSRSFDELGNKWTSVEIGDTLVSRYDGGGSDAHEMSAPKITVGISPGAEGPDILHVVWSEYNYESKIQEVYYSCSKDIGQSWSGNGKNIMISYRGEQGQGDAYDPVITTTSESGKVVHVTWIQKQVGNYERIFYLRAVYNDGITWIPENEMSITENIPDRMLVSDLSMTSYFRDIHLIWQQTPDEGKAPEGWIYYAGSPDDGEYWTTYDQEVLPINNNDDFNMPINPTIAVTDKMEAHVFWSELHEESVEIHTSFNPAPMDDPYKWSGQEGDIIISMPDKDLIADANNVSVALDKLPDGSWEPQVIWDELNNDKSKAEQNHEIHYPPTKTWTLSTTVTGSGSIARSPDQDVFDDGDYVLLTANPSAGWSFDHWELDLGGSTNPYSLLMNSNKNVRAVFTEDPYIDMDANSVSGPTACNEGDTISIARSFSNTGTQDAGSFRYGLYLSTNTIISTGDNLVYSTSYSSMTAGATNSGSDIVPLPMGLTGTYYYGVYADDLYQVSESDEGNNWVASAGTLTITPREDVSLSIGWNLVSIPLVQADTTITTVLTSISGNYEI